MSAIHPEMQQLVTGAAKPAPRDVPLCVICRRRVDFFLVGRESITREWWFIAKCHGSTVLVRPHWGDHAMIQDESVLRMIRLFKTRGIR